MVAVFKLGFSEFWGSKTIQLRIVYLSVERMVEIKVIRIGRYGCIYWESM